MRVPDEKSDCCRPLNQTPLITILITLPWGDYFRCALRKDHFGDLMPPAPHSWGTPRSNVNFGVGFITTHPIPTKKQPSIVRPWESAFREGFIFSLPSAVQVFFTTKWLKLIRTYWRTGWVTANNWIPETSNSNWLDFASKTWKLRWKTQINSEFATLNHVKVLAMCRFCF